MNVFAVCQKFLFSAVLFPALGECRKSYSYFPVIADNSCTEINLVIHVNIYEHKSVPALGERGNYLFPFPCKLLAIFTMSMYWPNGKNASAWENVGILTFLFLCKFCEENPSQLRLV